MNSRVSIGIFGSSDFAHEVAEIIELNGDRPILIASTEEERLTVKSAHRVISQYSMDEANIDGYVIAVSNNKLRERIYEKHSDLNWVNVVHPNTSVSEEGAQSLERHAGCIILAGVGVTSNVQFGNFNILSSNASVSFGCKLNDFCNISSGAYIEGNVELGRGVFIGINSSVINTNTKNRKIVVGSGIHTVVGTVVTKSIEEAGTYFGVTAQKITDESLPFSLNGKTIGIFGASGFAREVADIVISNGGHPVLISNSTDDVVGWSHPYKLVLEADVEFTDFDGFLIGVGDNDVRMEIYNRNRQLAWVNTIHPSVTFGVGSLQAITQTHGTIVGAGVRLTNNIEFGNFIILNLNSTVGHDTEIGDFCNLAPGVNLSGHVALEDRVYLGTNSCVINGIETEKLTICDDITVGAGAVVHRSLLDSGIYAGVPAKRIK